MTKTTLAIAALLACNLAHAATQEVTVTFFDPTQSLNTFNGFQFRGECGSGPGGDHEMTLWPLPQADGHLYTWFCPHHGGDEPHLEPQLWITRPDGKPFSLLGFDTAYNGTVRVQSSRGGRLNTDPVTFCFPQEPDEPNVPCQWDLTNDIIDPLFRDVHWVTLCPGCDPDEPDHHQVGLYDNVRLSYQVPEPPTWLLLLSSLVGGVTLSRWKYLMRDRRKDYR